MSLLRSTGRCDAYEDEAECDEALAMVLCGSHRPERASVDFSPPFETAGPYRLLAKISAGGMGTVYRVVHTRLERVLAMKILSPDRLTQPQAVARFDDEIRIVGSLDHPNIVRPTDASEANGLRFLVMEYVDGVDVAGLLETSGRLATAEACEIVRQAAQGLQYAHEGGVIHRDVKPSNLMIDRHRTVKILDFGIAHLRGNSGDAATTGQQLLGTLDFMAPEQFDDPHHVDVRADVYSLGATLYALLCGEPPLRCGRSHGLLEKVKALATAEITPLCERNPDVPADLASVVDKMLAADLSRRFASAAEVAEAIEPWAVGSDLGQLVTQAVRARASAETIGLQQRDTDGEAVFAGPQLDSARDSRIRAWPWIAGACLALAAAFTVIVLIRGDFGEIAVEVPGDDAQVTVQRDQAGTGAREEKSVEPPVTFGWPPPECDGSWPPGLARGVLPGILPRPAQLEGLDRWQVRFAQQAMPKPEDYQGRIRGVAWTSDGDLLAVASGRSDLHLISRQGRVVQHRGDASQAAGKLLAWSPDGQRLATTSFDGQVRLWDRNLQLLHVLSGHDGCTLSAAWDPVCGRLATGDSFGGIRIWDAEGNPLAQLESQGWVWGLAWSPDGQWLAAQALHEVKLWDADLAPGPTLSCDGETVGIAWSPDNRRLAVACMRAGTVQIWNRDWQLEKILTGHTAQAWAVAWSADGQRLASAGTDGRVMIWNGDGRLLYRLPPSADYVLTLAFAPDGRLAVGGYDGRLSMWDGDQPVWTLAVLPTGQTATYSAGGQLMDGDPQAIDTALVYVVEETSGVAREMKPSEFYQTLPLQPDTERPAAADPWNQAAQREVVWNLGPAPESVAGIVPRPARLPDVASWQIHFPEPDIPPVDGGPQCVRCARWSPDGSSLTLSDGGGYLHQFDSNGLLQRSVKAHSGCMYRIAWSADGQRLASTGVDGTVRLWTERLDPICIRREHEGALTLAAAWDAVSGRLATADSAGCIRVWDRDGVLLREFETDDEWTFALAWSPDGKWLISEDCVWDRDLEPGPAIPHVHGPADYAWSPDGRWLAGAYQKDRVVRLWRFPWEPGPVLERHKGELWGLAWSHDGQRLATAADDGLVKIWNVDGELLRELQAHKGRVWTLSFAPDGTLVSGSYDQTAIAWDAETGEPKWVIALLKDGQTATFNAAGQLIDGNLDAVEESLVYTVETEDGQPETLPPTDFYRRVPEARLAIKANPAN